MDKDYGFQLKALDPKLYTPKVPRPKEWLQRSRRAGIFDFGMSRKAWRMLCK